MIVNNFVPSALEAVAFLHSYTSQLEGKCADLFLIKSIMEEDHFHDPGMIHERIAVNRYFSILFVKDRRSLLQPTSVNFK